MVPRSSRGLPYISCGGTLCCVEDQLLLLLLLLLEDCFARDERVDAWDLVAVRTGSGSACDCSGDADDEAARRSRSSRRRFNFLPIKKLAKRTAGPAGGYAR